MAIKEYLAIGGLSSDLIGAFLLAVPALLGVRTALGWVLRVRGRLRRHLHLLNLSLSHHRRALKRKREIMFGWGGPSDLKKQAAGEQVDITPYYLIPSSLFVGVRHRFLSVLGLFNSHHRCCFHRCLYYAPSRNFNLQYSCTRSSVGLQGETGEKNGLAGLRVPTDRVCSASLHQLHVIASVAAKRRSL